VTAEVFVVVMTTKAPLVGGLPVDQPVLELQLPLAPLQVSVVARASLGQNNAAVAAAPSNACTDRFTRIWPSPATPHRRRPWLFNFMSPSTRKCFHQSANITPLLRQLGQMAGRALHYNKGKDTGRWIGNQAKCLNSVGGFSRSRWSKTPGMIRARNYQLH
jgi:hypothetical protein